MTMTADDEELPDHKPTPPPHDRVVVLATLACGVALVTVGHLTAEGAVAILGSLGAFYREFRD